ncbi:pyridoxal phosphate-dependent aminotransferase [Pelagerythrobacter rhizovicinus]|uniref:Pyridoxal phosphate-dependent aminotransferase n=1 Tax=Pelagerythrobacter rhizovicinus TaxID=2268576 RepID=A0A4Q2KMB4_9SPHN|nr:pyridoxal phosphate-dependent aminotransferase [Pelagerythrobacter rhizovicinus]RXZ65577.1 pyridoxal phosphate-dependent aminotransferase [Pelagerythrobacter rhizovicinus]
MIRFDQDAPGGGPGGTLPAPRFGSYSQWVRDVIRKVRSERNLLISLFESSVPEPADLLHEVIREAFGETVTTRYASAFAGGNPYVIDQLAARYGVERERVLCTTGATGALSLLYRALLAPGERILAESPGFDIFDTVARSLNKPIDRFLRRGDGFTIDPDEVERAMTPQTRLILLSNLHNPSGMAIAPEVLAAIARMAEERGALVVVDEVYGEYAGDAFTPAASGNASPALVSVSSLTKIWGLSTLRCGWIVAHPSVIEPVRALNREVEFGISNLAHAVAALVLEQRDRFERYREGMLQQARPIIESYHAHWLAEGLMAGRLPPHGCIAFPRAIGIDDTEHFSEWLADRCGVVVVPGEHFGAPGHIRIGFAHAPADVDYGLQALTDGLKHYRELDEHRGRGG